MSVRKEDVVEYVGRSEIVRSKGTVCTEEEGRTRQEHKDECDINRIVKRMEQGQVPWLNDQPVYGDFTHIKDLHSALEQVREATEAFARVPPQVRAAFDNDPAKFTDAFQSEEGIKKLKELKLIPPTEWELADARERAAEDRAAARALERERKRRVEEAARDVPPVVPPVKGG